MFEQRQAAQLRNQLEERGRPADKSFPDNRYLRFEKGEPILTPVQAAPDPDGLELDQSLALIKERMEPIEILDAFADTEYWLNWTRHFGPISGLESKLKRARDRYLLTVFSYGCNLGPVQTALPFIRKPQNIETGMVSPVVAAAG